MKTIFCFILGLATAFSVSAQSPNLFTYQGVAKGQNGSVLASKTIQLRTSVQSLNGSITYYSETRQVTTSSSGLFAFQIGSAGATQVTGNIRLIPWNNPNLTLKTEMDPNGGTAFVNLGSQAFSSVPYARYSDVAAALSPTATFAPFNISKANATPGSVLLSGNSALSVSNQLLTPVSTLTLPYLATTNYSDLRHAITLTNASTGTVFNADGSMGSILMSESGHALTATSFSANSAMRVSSPSTSPLAIEATATGTSGSAIKASSASGLALNSSGRILLRSVNTLKIPVSDANGEVQWLTPSNVTSALNVKSNQIIGGTSSGENTIQFDALPSLYVVNSSPQNWDANTSRFTATSKGTYRVAGMLQLEGFQSLLTTTPCVKSATYFCRITNPANPALNRTEVLGVKNSPFGWSSSLTVTTDRYLDLNEGETVEFVAASEFRNVNPAIKAGSICISLFRPRI